MRLNRREVMRDAHSRYRRRKGGPFELSFSECLRRAWEAAKNVQAYHAAPIVRRRSGPFPKQIAA